MQHISSTSIQNGKGSGPNSAFLTRPTVPDFESAGLYRRKRNSYTGNMRFINIAATHPMANFFPLISCYCLKRLLSADSDFGLSNRFLVYFIIAKTL